MKRKTLALAIMHIFPDDILFQPGFVRKEMKIEAHKSCASINTFPSITMREQALIVSLVFYHHQFPGILRLAIDPYTIEVKPGSHVPGSQRHLIKTCMAPHFYFRGLFPGHVINLYLHRTIFLALEDVVSDADGKKGVLPHPRRMRIENHGLINGRRQIRRSGQSRRYAHGR